MEQKVNGGTAFIYNKKQERILIGDNKVLNVILFLKEKASTMDDVAAFLRSQLHIAEGDASKVVSSCLDQDILVETDDYDA